MKKTVIRPMRLSDYDAMISLWQTTPGVRLIAADSKLSIGRFLKRNPGFSFVALVNGAIKATAMAGHDGRRGLLYHVAVDVSCRRMGLASQLVNRCMAKLRAAKIDKVQLLVVRGNRLGEAFWKASGWELRKDVLLFAKEV